MARLPRSMLPPEGIYHVTARGVDRCAIVRDDVDREFFVRRLRRVAGGERLVVHAWCLMDNHYHAIVECSLDRLSHALQRLNGGHAQGFNRRHGRLGHLFQGRFDAKVVRDEAHLARACTYTWDNPVRADLCETAEQWPWSGRFGATS
jgi:REP element-mobilizing transposase RayT